MSLVLFGGWAVDPVRFPAGGLVVSGGLGVDGLFEEEMAKRYAAKVHVYDFTPLAHAYAAQRGWKSNPALHNTALSATADEITYFVTDRTDHVSSSEYKSHPNHLRGMAIQKVKAIDLTELLRQYQHIDLLKLDIEGSEIGLLQSISAAMAKKITQICVEFHFHIIKELRGTELEMQTQLQQMGYAGTKIGAHEWHFVWSKG